MEKFIAMYNFIYGKLYDMEDTDLQKVRALSNAKLEKYERLKKQKAFKMIERFVGMARHDAFVSDREIAALVLTYEFYKLD